MDVRDPTLASQSSSMDSLLLCWAAWRGKKEIRERGFAWGYTSLRVGSPVSEMIQAINGFQRAVMEWVLFSFMMELHGGKRYSTCAPPGPGALKYCTLSSPNAIHTIPSAIVIFTRPELSHVSKSAQKHQHQTEHLLSISPDSISSLTALGLRPSTWHPVLYAVPRISLTVPFSSFAMLLNRIVRAMLIISSSGIDLVCLIFFSFLRSRGGSLSALMTSEEAEGTTETAAWRFWMVSLTVTRRPFCGAG